MLQFVVVSLVLIGAANALPTRPNSWLAMISSGGSCVAAGHRNGCCQNGINGCTVRSPGGMTCFCDEACFATGECCSDIRAIGCYATTCANAGLDPGCCSWFQTNCHTGRCYCDTWCYFFNDCCRDVPQRSPLCSKQKVQNQGQKKFHSEDSLRRFLPRAQASVNLQSTSQPKWNDNS